MKRSDIFIQLKDHKPNFNNNTDARLINPNKQDLGRISNKILRKIVNKIKVKTRLNLWIDSSNVIDWFRNIEGKEQKEFIQLDVTKMYPSAT